MFKRILIIFTVFLTLIESVFAEINLSAPFVQIFGEGGLFSILSNEYIVISLIYLAILFGFFSIIKIGLKFVFRGHEKEMKVVSFMISFIGSTGIFFIYKGTPAEMIATFGGSIGFFMISIIMILGLKGLDFFLVESGSNRFSSKKWWLFMSLGVFVVSSVLISIIKKTLETISGNSPIISIAVLETVQSWALVIFLFVLIPYFFFKQNENKAVIIAENPDVSKAKILIESLDKDIEKLKNLGEKLKGTL